MPSYQCQVDQDGRIQLPDDLRERFEIPPGGTVEFFVTLDGLVFFHALTEASGESALIQGMSGRRPPLSVREMDEAIAEHLVEKHARIAREAREDSSSAA
jgi:bifunctional DNA-binding transcriptional regulator/antitoxin component of YhaV-PrlF toxin-antitoxin module